MAKPKDPETSTGPDAEMGYDPRLIKVHENLEPRYSGTDHVEHGRPHSDHGDQDYDPSSLDVLSGLEPSTFKRGVNIAVGPQPNESDDPVEP